MTNRIIDNELNEINGGAGLGASYDPSRVGALISTCKYNAKQYKTLAGADTDTADRILTCLERADSANYNKNSSKAKTELENALNYVNRLDQSIDCVKKMISALNSALSELAVR